MTEALSLAFPRPFLMAGEKSQAPTPRRRQRARQEGQGWFSPDFQAGLALLVGVVVLRWYLPYTGRTLTHMEAAILMLSTGPDFSLAFFDAWSTALRAAVEVLIPLTIPVAGVGVMIGFFQSGFRFSTKPLMPSFSKINPFEGLKRMFSRKGLWLLVKGLLKMTIIGLAAGLVIRGQFSTYPKLLEMSLGSALTQSSQMLTSVLMRAAEAFFLMGAVDLAYQYVSFQNSLKMTKEEIRDEMKDSEGNPEIKGRRRQMARRLARGGLKEVKNAEVVITNPTHFAVALKWDEKTMRAPEVAAKGTDEVALEMREIAYDYQIPIIENPPLARSLYLVPIGDPIQEDHYQAVADILAFIIQRRTGGARR